MTEAAEEFVVQDLIESIGLTDRSRQQMDDFRTSYDTRVLTILFTDIEGSTRQQMELGNLAAAALVKAYRTIYREVLAKFDGREVETAGDSILSVFAAPSEAVRFVLYMESAMRAAREREPSLPVARVGLHQGQVVREDHAVVTKTGKSLDIYGLQVSTAARIMDLARGGQILCSRSVFDDARAILRGEALAGLSDVTWINHGPYIFKGVEDPYEVCEVGEAAFAPLEKPQGSAKSHPVESGDELFGWRPGPEAVVPTTNWRLSRKLGEGGFGEVWLSEDRDQPLRKMVFKFCTRRSRIKSLRREKDVFDHLLGPDGKPLPGIVQVLGAHDDAESGEPPYYIQLEYCAGGDLSKWIDEHGRAALPRIKLDVALQLVRALERIHAAGFVHRDVKPSNFLLDAWDDPARAPVVKMCDFGIGQEVLAEAIAEGRATGELHGGGGRFSLRSATLAEAAGTFLFIAPELVIHSDSTPGRVGRQAETSADIYSLGVTLYQLFAGSAQAVPGPGLRDVTDPILREDFEACLDPNPENRPTASALADRLERYEERRLERQRAEQRARARRIRRGLYVLSAFLGVATILGAAAAYQWREAVEQREQANTQKSIADTQRKKAEAAQAESEARLYESTVLLARTQIGSGQFTLAAETLWRAPERFRNWEWGYFVQKSDPALHTFTGHTDVVMWAGYSPDGSHVFTVSQDGTGRLWNTRADAAPIVFSGHTSGVVSGAFSPDGTRIVSGSRDHTVRVWDAATGAQVFKMDGFEESPFCVSFSPDGARILAAALDGRGRVFDAQTGDPVCSIEGHEQGIVAATYNPDGTRILTCSFDGTARVWDATSGKQLHLLNGHSDGVYEGAFSPDGERIVTGSADKTARVWDANSGRELFVLEGHDDWLTAVAFTHDGARIATTAYDGAACIWDAATGNKIAQLKNPAGPLRTAVFNRAGSLLLTGSVDGSIVVWDIAAQTVFARYVGHVAEVGTAVFSPDERTILSGSEDGTAKVWPVRPYVDGTLLRGYNESVVAEQWRPDSKRIVTAGQEYSARVWDPDTGMQVAKLNGHAKAINTVDFDSKGSRIVTASNDGTARIWDAETGNALLVLETEGARRSKYADSFAPVAEDDTLADFMNFSDDYDAVKSAEFSPDDQRVVLALGDSAAEIWDAERGVRLFQLIGHEDRVYDATYSPDGDLIATASADGTARIWSAIDGSQLQELRGHFQSVFQVAFSPDAKQLLTVSGDMSERVWNVETGDQVSVLDGSDSSTNTATFSPDGKTILTASWDRLARLVDPETGELIAALEGHAGAVTSARFSPDGSRIVTTSDDLTVRVWDAATGTELARLEGHPSNYLFSAVFSPDGTRILSIANPGEGRVWDAVPYRSDMLPGDDSMDWRRRYKMWRLERYHAWLDASQAAPD